MKKSLEERLKYAIENNNLIFEKFFGDGSKWYYYYLVVVELVWVRNFYDGYVIFVYNNEYQDEHIATFTVDYVSNPQGGYWLVPRFKTIFNKSLCPTFIS